MTRLFLSALIRNLGVLLILVGALLVWTGFFA